MLCSGEVHGQSGVKGWWSEVWRRAHRVSELRARQGVGGWPWMKDYTGFWAFLLRLSRDVSIPLACDEARLDEEIGLML